MTRSLSNARAALRLAVAVLLAALLAGCWYSEAPLLDASNASPFAGAGKYADPEGGQSPLEIVARADGSYDLAGGDATLNAWFLDVGRGWYVYQMSADDGDKAPQDGREHERFVLYNLARFRDGSLAMYDPDCDEATAAIAGVEDDGHGGCRIAGLRELKRAARRFADAVEEGTITAEPQVFPPWRGD